MRHLFFILLSLSLAATLNAKGIKIDCKTVIKPYTIKIEKTETIGDQQYVYGKIKQQERFSYSISFEDCYVTSDNNSTSVTQGELIKWNDDKKVGNKIKTISDEEDEEFILAFPAGTIPDSGKFNLKLGNIQDRQKTDIVIYDLELKKK